MRSIEIVSSNIFGDAAAMLARSVIDKSSLSSFCSIALDELRHDRLTELNLRDKNIGNND